MGEKSLSDDVRRRGQFLQGEAFEVGKGLSELKSHFGIGEGPMRKGEDLLESSPYLEAALFSGESG